MIYKFVIITFLAFHVHSQYYNGWNYGAQYGQYVSIAQASSVFIPHHAINGNNRNPAQVSTASYAIHGNYRNPAPASRPPSAINVDNRRAAPVSKAPHAINGNNRQPAPVSKPNHAINGNNRKPAPVTKPHQAVNNNGNNRKPAPGSKPHQAANNNGNNRKPAPVSKPHQAANNNGNNRKPAPVPKPHNAVNGDNKQGGANQQPIRGAPKKSATLNSCEENSEPKPNFKKLGRRISEEKCLEFIWDIKAQGETSNCTSHRRRPYGSHVHGGRKAEPGEFPHMVALGWKAVEQYTYIFKCGGSIISPNFVVTAGHCTKTRKDPKISNLVPEIVRVGAKNLQFIENGHRRVTYPKDIKITKIIPHPSYKPPRQYFDIALLQLEENLSFNENVQVACLWNNLKTDTIGKVSTSGWGATETSGKQTVTELRVGDLDLIKEDLCNNLLKPMCKQRLWCGLESHQMCAGKLAGGVDACQGDSGGPLQVQINLHPSIKGKIYYLLGVTSFGFGCARPNSPGVYTKTAAFIDWIEQNVWPNERRQ